MASLEKKTKQFCIIIRKKVVLDITYLKAFCDHNFVKYAFITHLKDDNEKIHYHIVGVSDKQVRLSTMLNRLVDWFQFDNAFGIEIDSVRSIEGSVQYLTHKNQPEKEYYEFEDIYYKWNEKEFKLLYESNFIDEELSSDSLIFLVKDSVCCFNPLTNKYVINIPLLIRSMGLKKFNRYQGIIKMLIKYYEEYSLNDIGKSNEKEN